MATVWVSSLPGAVDVSVWREIVASAPSTFGRLVRLASFWEPTNGRYCHVPLGEQCSPDMLDAALRLTHERVFATWLGYLLRHQRVDLELYLSSLPEGRAAALATWLRPDAFEALPPTSARRVDRLLFLCDLRAVVTVLSSELGATESRGDTPSTETVDWRVCRLQHWANEQRGDIRLTLGAVAQRLRTSVRHMGRLFRHQTGLAFRDYLLAMRMRRAAELLRNDTGTIQWVAEEVGYSDPCNFSRDFKRHFGRCPRTYRLQAQLRESLPGFWLKVSGPPNSGLRPSTGRSPHAQTAQ